MLADVSDPDDDVQDPLDGDTYRPTGILGVDESATVETAERSRRWIRRTKSTPAPGRRSTHPVTLMLAVAALPLTLSLAVIYNPTGSALEGTGARTLALFPIGVHVLYLSTQYLEAADYEVDVEGDVDTLHSWIRFLVGLAFIVGVEELVRAAIGFGDVFGTPAFPRGMTVAAAGSMDIAFEHVVPT